MSREAMKQALEALEEINKLSIGENALCLPAEIDGAMDALRQALANEALDRMAENARELGLDYETPEERDKREFWAKEWEEQWRHMQKLKEKNT